MRDIKKELHTYYDVIWASEPRVIFAPLFEKAPSLVDFKDKEIAELKQLMKSNKEVELMNIKAGIFAAPRPRSPTSARSSVSCRRGRTTARSRAP